MLIALTASPAAADLPSKAPRLSLVQVLVAATQALVLDRTTGEYRVVKVGDTVQGFRVTGIEEDQIVVASPVSPERLFVLAKLEAEAVLPRSLAAGAGAQAPPGTAGGPVVAPAQPGPALPGPAQPGASAGAQPAVDADVLDPYAIAGAGQPSLLDPHGAPAEPGRMPSVVAPPASRVAPGSEPGAGVGSPPVPGSGVGSSAASGAVGSSAAAGAVGGVGSSAVPGAVGSSAVPGAGAGSAAMPSAPPAPGLGLGLTLGVDPSTTGAPADPAPEPSRAPMDSKVTTVPPTEVRARASSMAAGSYLPDEQPRMLSRRELDAALADFSALARQMRIERARGGGIRILELERGSFVAQVGLERGDVVKRVAGLPIDTVDQAAAAYAALASARDVLVEVERRGTSLRIRYYLTR